MTDFSNLTSNGIPVFGGGNTGPIFGKAYFVDGTNGSDDNPGTHETPKATIQAAVTLQIAENSGLGDVIYIMPGTYAETVYASDMTNVLMQGCGFTPGAVSIEPTDHHALLIGVDGSDTATMTNSVVRNILFKTPSTSNVWHAAMTVGFMKNSVIENCKFDSTTTAIDVAGQRTIGLQIGNETDTDFEYHEGSRISNCKFTTNAGRAKELSVGILVGAFDSSTPEYRGFKNMVIEDCVITAFSHGIEMWTGASSCDGSLIRRNHIHSNQAGMGPNFGIICKNADTDTLTMIHDNRINGAQEGISNFSAFNTFGNIVSVSGNAAAGELPTSS